MLQKNLCADLLKMKWLPVTLAHILIPVIISGIFLSYYSFSAWSDQTKVVAFYQAVGAGFPVLIGIFTAGVVEQEQNAGEFQNLLTLPEKCAAFVSKLLLLLMFSLFALLLTAVLFGFVFDGWIAKDTMGISIHLAAVFIMWCSSIPVYIWQYIVAFTFGKGVSAGVGIASGLVSALMLTGLGDYVWKYTFISWTGRMPYMYLKWIFGEAGVGKELVTATLFGCIFTVGSMIYYLWWISRFEGCRISE